MSVSAQAQQLRHAVTECIESGPVIVGCSGGPDSLALADAAAWAVPHIGGTLTVVVVDHGLQSDSAEVAERAADACRAVGIDDVQIRRVQVGTQGGPEAAARNARRQALLDVAQERDAHQIMLAHTLDDQAETVLLRLARGSGARSLAAMQSCDGFWHRPFLDLPRHLVHEVARERFEPLGFTPWDDPHNHDPQFARVRVRKSLDILESDLGPGLAANLARSAKLLGDDADALDVWALGDFARIVHAEKSSCSADITALAEMPRAVRTRLLRLMHQQIVGVHEDLSFDHIQQVEAMVSRWKGQGPTSLPGAVTANVEYGRLTLSVQPQEM
ncbi:MAG: tRNA lysidine(34) synthetase TilS [Actinomycetota bacterium]|nr:tRNA lysidine(34) synthetase TilS [Actinomycetota bacterium]